MQKEQQMNHQYNFHSIIEKLYTVQKLSDKVPRYYGIDMCLYTSEIHLLDLIAQHPTDNISELANRLWVSKMSVSAKARKLQSKGLLNIVAGKNKKELLCVLTEKGSTAVKTHQDYHRQENLFLSENLSKYSDNEIKLVEKFLLDYEQYLELYSKDSNIL